jgi:hypothetical protein
LERSLTDLQTSQPLPPDCAQWLAFGLSEWLAGGPLEDALQLSRTERNAVLRARRN